MREILMGTNRDVYRGLLGQSNLIKRPPPMATTIFNFHSTKLLLNNDYLSTTGTNLGSQGWSFVTIMTLYLKMT